MLNHRDHYHNDALNFDYFDWNQHLSTEHRRRYEHIAHMLQLECGHKVLEIGSGGGPGLRLMQNTQIQYFPFDLSWGNLHKIQQISPQALHPVLGDSFHLPFADSCFDRVVLSEVLEHLPKPDLAIAEIQRVLKKGGRLVISVPWRENIQYHLCIHCNQTTPAHAHLHSWDEIKLSELGKSQGLNPRQIDYTLHKVLHRLLGPKLDFLPFSIWKFLDSLCQKIWPKAASMLLSLDK